MTEVSAVVGASPHAEIEAIVTKLNASRPDARHVRYEGPAPFGQGMIVQRFALANGLRVLIEVDPAAPVVCLQTWMRVGSRFEKTGKTGISHLFEHLMFGETEESAHGAFDRMLEEAGGETNAATSLDWTYYHQNLPREALALGLRLEAERMGKLILREPQVASEKEVVANERRQRVDDDVDGAVNEILYREAFRTHAYGIPTIGWMQDILGFTPEDCVSFYRTYYAPNNATLVLVGDVDLEASLGLIADHMGALVASDIPVEDVKPEPPQTEERRIEVDKPSPTHRVAIGYKCPALGDFDHAPLVVLNEILFGGRSSRVHRRLLKELEIATEVRGWVGTGRDPSLYDISLTARDDVTGEALLAAFDAEIAKVLADPVQEAELDRAKSRLELGTLQSLESVSGRAETIGFYDTVLGEPGALFTKLDAYRRVTRSDVLRVARRCLVNDVRTLVLVRPTADEPDGEGEDEGDEVAA
ncbi:MAG: insulinase family protein [Polyangiaceae bacterium]|nr:insulinase family protein [Polyangiaceae bacterium]